jgi:nicotinamidase-related amidase
MTTALAVIDMQNWMFRTPERTAKLSQLVEGVNRALATAAALRWLVFEIRTEWPSAPTAWSLRAQRANATVLQAGSSDVQPVTGLNFPAQRETIIKTRHSAFVGTDFEHRLKTQNVVRLLIAGCWLDGCVTQTAIDGYERNIDTLVLADAVACINDAQAEFVRRWANHLGDVPYLPLAEVADVENSSPSS